MACYDKWNCSWLRFLTVAIYLLTGLCIAINILIIVCVPFDSHIITSLRDYHLAVGVLMSSSGSLMVIFMWNAYHSRFRRLARPYAIAQPSLIFICFMTCGIVIGYTYFMTFNFAFINCNKLIDADSKYELWQETVDSLMMIIFCVVSLLYILQRSYFGSINTPFDNFTRRWINATFMIVWVKLIISKGYISYQEICQREEIIYTAWCQAIRRRYSCDPKEVLDGTQMIWYLLHKNLLHSAITSCASEFFPIMLVGHWLACGRAEERAALLIQRKQKKNLPQILWELVAEVSQIYGVPENVFPPSLEITSCAMHTLVVAAWAAGVLAVLRWFKGLYVSIRFDQLHAEQSTSEDYVEFVASITQLILFALTFKWSLSIKEERLDVHHRAEARGDLVIILGSVTFTTIKLVFHILELYFQLTDDFLPLHECLLRIVSLILIQVSEWLQFFTLRRVMSLSENDIRSTGFFLPSVAFCSIIVNWVGFGMAFFETNLIKYQLQNSKIHYSPKTMRMMVFTQTIYPGNFLLTFSTAGCWIHILLRYVEIGWFELGKTQTIDGRVDKRKNSLNKLAEDLENIEQTPSIAIIELV